MNSRKMVAAIALSVICGGLVMAADNKNPIAADTRNPIKEIAVAQADAESALVAAQRIFGDQDPKTSYGGNNGKYRALFNDGMECIRKARDAERSKGENRIEGFISGCNDDETDMNLKNRANEETMRQTDVAWQKAAQKMGTLRQSFDGLRGLGESWKNTGLDVAPIVAMHNSIAAAMATVKQDAEKCVAQAVALAGEMDTKVKDLKAKYGAPGK